MGDWIDDHLGWLITAGVVGLFAILFLAFRAEDRQTRAACLKMWSYARTAHDSLEVTQACDKPKQPDVIPVYIPINTGR